ncbi:hypothetical protein BKA58DRAFT_433361 [Alternaria rosae]|uniref:uncharacterized protein n=1 Tax=Alternaria rosae TaxID=1187941 RepID=UPI001E8E15AB|nr:uncharacterized protein BKA58DRAFT_433361 [Alternaria rosae]KAH6881580.1 hypothetical protein BKA58DRAFT_433361 [Alternaria rosae]
MTTSATPAAQYKAAHQKGLSLLQMLEASSDELGELLKDTGMPAESEYLNYKDLLEYKWFEVSFKDDSKTLMRLSEDLGINTLSNIPVSHNHRGLKSIKGLLQGGLSMQIHFDSVISPSGGMIAAMNTYSPLEDWRRARADAEKTTGKAELKPTEKDNVGDDIPSLKFWSDVAYLQWAKHTKVLSDLRYVMRISIMNTKTKAVVQHIVKDAPVNGDESYSFRIDDDRDHVAALLGTPNGAGVAWLLIQHKRQLGHKTVNKVTLDCHDKSIMPRDNTIVPSLVFHIRDLVAPGAGREEVGLRKSL